MYMFVYMWQGDVHVLVEARENAGSPGARFRVSCKLSDTDAEGPLQEQSWLLTTEPFHQPQEIVLESVFVRL